MAVRPLQRHARQAYRQTCLGCMLLHIGGTITLTELKWHKEASSSLLQDIVRILTYDSDKLNIDTFDFYIGKAAMAAASNAAAHLDKCVRCHALYLAAIVRLKR